MPYFLDYLNFLLRATNQHGVHSPFVYAFVTKCLYRKSHAKRTTKSLDVFLKSKAYFKAESIKLYTESTGLKEELKKEFVFNPNQKQPFDLVYIDRSSQHLILEFLRKNDNWHNNSMVLLDGIYSTKESQHLWKKVKALPITSVTVDLFYCGVLFFRKEQVPQHFKIRI